MRPLSLVLALAFLIGGPLVGHCPRAQLPGAGAFTYTGTPLAPGVPQILAAAR